MINDTLGLTLFDYNALMALTGLICGLLVSAFTAIILKITL